MNATDLMLGDYVQVKDEEGNLITDYICDIGYVPQWNELGVRTCKCGNEWLRESKIMPIPLSKEVILKNFEVNEHIMQLKKEELGIDNPEWLYLTYKNEYSEWVLSWELSLYNEGFSLFIYDCPLPEIHYVHELQHFLKLCRTNKEIIL